jgi:hypothetical protein
MKGTLARLGIRGFKPTLRNAPERRRRCAWLHHGWDQDGPPHTSLRRGASRYWRVPPLITHIPRDRSPPDSCKKEEHRSTISLTRSSPIQVVAGGGQDGVDPIAVEIIAVEAVLGLQVIDHGFDHGAAPSSRGGSPW